MSSDSFTIKQNDRLNALERTLKNADGSAIDLSSAVSVTFRMRLLRDTSLKIERVATIVEAANGKVKYNWQSGDTDVAGTYEAEFEVVFSGGLPLTVPNDGHFEVNVVEELG